jgi:hypothetical protein
MKRMSSGMLRRITSALTATVVLMNLANAAGDIVWFNGGFDNRNGLASERNTQVSDARTYEDFSLPSGYNVVTGLLGQFYLSAVLVNAPVYWEIRQGVAAGTGGTLIASGTQSGATYTAIGSGFGFTIYEIRMKLDNPVNLSPNTVYWMTMAPVGNGSGRAFVATTNGAGAIGAPTGGDNAIFDSSYFNANWVPVAGNIFSDTTQANFSYGVQAIPEPASMLALGAGLAGLLGLRRRACK